MGVRWGEWSGYLVIWHGSEMEGVELIYGNMAWGEMGGGKGGYMVIWHWSEMGGGKGGYMVIWH